jgi:penicillin-binding protein 1B
MNEQDPAAERRTRVFRVQSAAAFFRKPLFKIILSVFLFFLIASSGVVLYYYNYYSRIIDRKVSGEVFKQTAKIYAAPYRIHTGQRLSAQAVVSRLQRAGFELAGKGNSEDGYYEVEDNRITIRPASGEAMRLEFRRESLARIVKLSGGPGAQMSESWLPAELVTNLADETRQKRRVVEFSEMPPHLVNALVAAEDQRFFRHWGLDPIRIVGAIVDSVRSSKRVQGVSTITQQLARNFFLTLDRSMVRKVHEMFIALLLEQRLTKEQILTMYANEIYLGNRGSFEIRGFGEAAAAYFGKDLGELTLPEAATLAGIIPSPNPYSPSKYPDRAKTRRNLVLNAMHSHGTITDEEFEESKEAEVKVAPIKLDASDAPYLVDYIREELLKNYSEEQLTNDSLRVYTTLDLDLQRVAVDAVQNGLKNAEEQLAARRGRKTDSNLPGPQAALIVIDPHTGHIKAMVGGSDYAESQYNRITEAFRQPGSIFKPFVFAAAFESAFDGQTPPISGTSAAPAPAPAIGLPTAAEAAPVMADPLVGVAPGSQFNQFLPNGGFVTPITTIYDEPTTFVYDGEKIYEPNNFNEEYRGLVTVRQALQHSLNVPTIKIAERIGYDRVAEFARRSGMNAKIRGYPSVALGAFEVTPLEMAGAYTVFANEGKRTQPNALLRVTSADGSDVRTFEHEAVQVIRPELAYLMTNLMESVINEGTGAGVRARGFGLPAAGKTGTSRDGWFAGYTKDLLAIAWVGFDDNRDLTLQGSRSALPIWTEFMIKANRLYPPRDPDAVYFERPSGIEYANIDPENHMVAGPGCPNTYAEIFIAGTVPTNYCPIHRFSISETIQDGIRETGEGIGGAIRGFGRFLGGLFGGSRNGDAEPDPLDSPATVKAQ